MSHGIIDKTIPMYQVDAFTDEPFRGNPAAVCILDEEISDTIMQNIAAEMNLSETAFLIPVEDMPLREMSRFQLRWFTPLVEVGLCGHATLATSAVLFDDIGIRAGEINYETKSGRLIARRDTRGILLDFPSEEPLPMEPPEELLNAMGIIEFENILHAKRNRILLVQLENEESVINTKPDFDKMMRTTIEEDIIGVIITSKGDSTYDFVSRFFAPWVGINEDPVTGAAHTVLTPYWSKVLKKKEMLAYQVSSRGGELVVQMETNDRVNLIGNAIITLKGEMYLK